MKKLIALRGVAKVGKSQTIRKAYDLLLAEYPSAHRDGLIGQIDMRVVLTIEGAMIGIESTGDPNSRLKASLKLFVQRGCQAILCATRTSGMAVDWVSRLSGTYNIVWLEQVAEPEPSKQHSRNAQMAANIVGEVRQVIAHNNALQRALPRR